MFNFIKDKLDFTKKELKKFERIADQIDNLSEDMKKLSDNELKNKTIEFKQRLQEGETLDDLLVEAFAVVREASLRAIGMYPFKVQLVGAITIHYGNIAEMKTGEGKTLVCVMPGYLNALEENGVHIVTTNEYLASFQSEWMGKIYEFLGMQVGCNLRELTKEEKKKAYDKDVTYTTNGELGFDYLRDNMVVRKEDRVISKGLNFAIVDEVDSILIDEARTPLIISGGLSNTANIYNQTDMFAKSLKNDKDFVMDEKTRNVTLTDEGVEKAEKSFNLSNLYDINNTVLVHHINQALRANHSLKRDTDYVVQDGKIVIVDKFTGRLMPGRAFSEGLHQAIEAKEHVEVQKETKTMATITFQNLFRMYKKLSGMTGTAKTEEEEFRNIYNMYVIEIPTNKPVIREDYADLVYPERDGKFNAIIKEIEKRHKLGQPLLIGTIAVETSEYLSNLLKKHNIKHEVLNAKNHAREAEIIAKAGEKGSVTIATNMAGRGTDIKLGEGVTELGGLCVIGTERHEARRIDNQLRGRAGRQGDPGSSQFFVSLDDELMVRFGTDKVKTMLKSVGFSKDQAIQSKMFTSSISTAQKRVEGNNFDYRKQILEYDNVLGQQREIIYKKRNNILDKEEIHDDVLASIKRYIESSVRNHIGDINEIKQEDLKEILEEINENIIIKSKDFKITDIKTDNPEEVIKIIEEKVLTEYKEKIEKLPYEIVNSFEKAISLRVIDTHWMEHMNTMDHLREGIFLRKIAQQDPLREYTMEGFNMFDEMLYKIDRDTAVYLLKAEIRQNTEAKQVLKGTAVETNDKSKKKTPKKVTKIGRNDPCPCGSGKKYKQCCGK